jgi:membrane protease YdiL (CAAX protease family)
MLRTWTYAWWRPVVGLFALVAGMLVIIPFALLPLLLVAAAIDGGGSEIGKAFSGLGGGGELTPSGLLYLNLTLAGLILWTWLIMRVLHSMRPRWLASVRPKLRWRYLFACLGLAVVALVAQLVVGALVPGDIPGADTAEPNAVDGRTIALLVIILFTTPLQAAGEEYAFRGYLLQGLGALLRNRWITIVLTALLFAAAHGQFDPPLFLDRFLFGLIAAWLVIRTGGLEAGIALHVLNNYLALGFAVFFDDLTKALDPGDVSWWNLPVSLTQSLVYAGLAAWVAGRMGLQTRTEPPGDTTPTDSGPTDDATDDPALVKVG